MAHLLPVPRSQSLPGRPGSPPPPAVVLRAGPQAEFAHEEFFAVDNEHTKRAYRAAVLRFLSWCEADCLELQAVRPGHVSTYLGELRTAGLSDPSRKVHLAALRKYFDRLTERHAVVLNPALSVRGPRVRVAEGKTPAFDRDEARLFLASVHTTDLAGLRDRAILSVLVYTAARVSAVAKLKVSDFYAGGRERWLLHFEEKGGKHREIPVRHDLRELLQRYLAASALAGAAPSSPLFQSVDWKTGQLTGRTMTQGDVLRMVKRRLKKAGFPISKFTCHSFRATTITDLLKQGLPLSDVQRLAGHADPRTTKLYDRTDREVTTNIVERISI